jgi:hypothetical protein
MGAVLDVLYEDGPPSAPAVASDTMASSVDLRPSRMPASTQGRHARPSASND